MKGKIIKYVLFGRTFENLELYDKPLWGIFDYDFYGFRSKFGKKDFFRSRY